MRDVAATAAVALAGIAALLWLGRDGWSRYVPNEQIAERRWFCEALHDGPVRQPANTWSNLGFVVAALAIARAQARPRATVASPMGEPRVSRLYVALVTFLGLGSMCLHATMTRWGGLVDVTSMLVFVAFPTAFGLARLRGLDGRGVIALWAAIATGAEALFLARPRVGVPLFGALVVAFAATELVRRREAGDRRWLAVAAACFGVGFAIWIPSQNGGALCAPGSLVQGHAAWHLLCASAAASLYFHFRST